MNSASDTSLLLMNVRCRDLGSVINSYLRNVTMDGGGDGRGRRVRHRNMSLFQEDQSSMMQEAQRSQPAAGMAGRSS